MVWVLQFNMSLKEKPDATQKEGVYVSGCRIRRHENRGRGKAAIDLIQLCDLPF